MSICVVGSRKKSVVVYKFENRLKIEQDGFRVRGNSGDQWSDLTGYYSWGQDIQAAQSHVLRCLILLFYLFLLNVQVYASGLYTMQL